MTDSGTHLPWPTLACQGDFDASWNFASAQPVVHHALLGRLTYCAEVLPTIRKTDRAHWVYQNFVQSTDRVLRFHEISLGLFMAGLEWNPGPPMKLWPAQNKYFKEPLNKSVKNWAESQRAVIENGVEVFLVAWYRQRSSLSWSPSVASTYLDELVFQLKQSKEVESQLHGVSISLLKHFPLKKAETVLYSTTSVPSRSDKALTKEQCRSARYAESQRLRRVEAAPRPLSVVRPTTQTPAYTTTPVSVATTTSPSPAPSAPIQIITEDEDIIALIVPEIKPADRLSPAQEATILACTTAPQPPRTTPVAEETVTFTPALSRGIIPFSATALYGEAEQLPLVHPTPSGPPRDHGDDDVYEPIDPSSPHQPPSPCNDVVIEVPDTYVIDGHRAPPVQNNLGFLDRVAYVIECVRGKDVIEYVNADKYSLPEHDERPINLHNFSREKFGATLETYAVQRSTFKWWPVLICIFLQLVELVLAIAGRPTAWAMILSAFSVLLASHINKAHIHYLWTGQNKHMLRRVIGVKYVSPPLISVLKISFDNMSHENVTKNLVTNTAVKNFVIDYGNQADSRIILDTVDHYMAHRSLNEICPVKLTAPML